MEDNELIYQYQIAYQQPAFIFLWKKYFNLIEKITFITFRKFSSIPLELSDFSSLQYFSFYNSMKTYRETANKSFSNYMQQRLKWDLLQYIRKYINKKHAVMNYAISYDTQYETTTVEQSYLVAEPKWINYGLSFLTKLENEVILLKSQDYSNEEISHKLNISYKSVDNAYQRAKVKLQKNRDCM